MLRRSKFWSGKSDTGAQSNAEALAGYNLQIIGHREDPRDAVGADAGGVLVSLVVYHAFESHVAVLDDDSDGFLHAQSVLLQRLVAIDGMEQLYAQAVVHMRRGPYFHLIFHAFNAFNVLYHILGVGLQRRADYLTIQKDVIALDLVFNDVVYTEQRK